MLEGLLDVVVGPRLDRIQREIDVAVRAHHDDGGFVALRLQRGQEIEAAHLGHADVGEDDVGAEGVDERERFFAALGGLDFVALSLQQGTQNETQVLFVVDHENPAHYAKITTRPPSGPQILLTAAHLESELGD